MSIKLMSALWDEATVKGSDLLCLLCLADHANDEGICWPSISRIATRTRLSERQVQYSISKLEDLGYAKRVKMGCNQHSTIYRISNPHESTVQNVHPHGAECAPHGERTFTLISNEPSLYSSPSSAKEADEAKSPPLSPEPDSPAEIADAVPPDKTPKLDPDDKRSLCALLYGHMDTHILPRVGHIAIAKLWKELSRTGIEVPVVLDWFNTVWEKTWPGNTGQLPRPNQVLIGVTSYVGRQEETVPPDQYEFVVLDD